MTRHAMKACTGVEIQLQGRLTLARLWCIHFQLHVEAVLTQGNEHITQSLQCFRQNLRLRPEPV
jgi:hypothetical protein